MKLVEPLALLALLAVIVVAAAYVVRLPFRRRFAVTLPTTGALARVAPRRPGWQRHASTVLFLAAIATTVFAFARPAQEHTVPTHLGSLIVALDTSNSMRATDVKPQRLDAAQQAAVQFVGTVPKFVHVGLVTFSGTAAIAVPPTSDHHRVRTAVAAAGFGEGTSLGEGIRASITAVEQQAADLELTAHRRGAVSTQPPAAVVMFSDGQQTLGADERVAVDVARRANVPVSTIAIGTRHGAVTLSGVRIDAPVDRPSLAAVAKATHGHAYVDRPGAELSGVYDAFTKRLGSTSDRRDLTGWLLGVALGLGAAALVAAFVWGQRVP
jgi:Ca-activated chloride channel family protein